MICVNEEGDMGMLDRTDRLLARLTAGGIVLLGAACSAPLDYAPGAAPVIAEDPPAVRLVAAIEDVGCELTADNVGTVLLRANLTQAELREITPQLDAAGRVEVAGDGAIRVLTERCI